MAEDGGSPREQLLDAAIAIAIVVALIGLLLLPLIHEENLNPVSGGRALAAQRDLCFDCAEDAPYPLLLWLELIVALAGLIAGLGLCFRGGGWYRVVRTVALVAAGVVLLWAPFRIETRELPIGVPAVVVAMGIAALVIAGLAFARAGPTFVSISRAISLAVATIALFVVPGTRGQMPSTYDRLLWGSIVALVATVAATVIAVVAAVGVPEGSDPGATTAPGATG